MYKIKLKKYLMKEWIKEWKRMNERTNERTRMNEWNKSVSEQREW